MSTKHLLISGKVQGVGYRAWMVREAKAMRLHGWVRNRKDGKVEAVLNGARESVDALVRKAYDGPDAGLVKDIAVTDIDVYDGPASFETRPDY